MLLASLLLLTILSSGHAAPADCPEHFSANGFAASFSPTALSFTGVSDSPLEAQIRELVPRLDQFLGTGRPAPLTVQLTDNSFYADAFFLPKEHAIKLGVRTGSRPPEARLGVFAHEYAHAYFGDKFRFLTAGEWRSEKDSWAFISALIKEMEATPRFIELQSEIKSIGNEISVARARNEKERLAAAVKRFDPLKAELEELKKPTDDLMRAQRRKEKIVRAFSELHSDALAALASRNTSVIAEALGIPPEGPYLSPAPGSSMRKKNPNGARPRSFEINRFKEWKPEDEFANEYALLDPARGVLWKLYLEKLSAEQAPKFFEAFVAASELEVQRLFLSEADDKLTKISAPELNRSFLRAFRAEAKQRGLPVLKAKP